MTLTVSQYGAGRYNEGVRYNETISITEDATFLEGRYGLQVMVYDPHTGLLKARYGSDIDENPIESAEFEFIETGCGSFRFSINTAPENLAIVRGDRIDIHLMHTIQPWFSGRITEIPALSTKEKWEYSGHGWAELLDEIIIDYVAYTGQSIESIVADLADSYLPIEISYRPDEFLDPIGYTIDTPAGGGSAIAFQKITLKKAFERLAELAQGYRFGVDEQRCFYFRAPEGLPWQRYSDKASHWLGYSVDDFELKEEGSKVQNVLHAKAGIINTDAGDEDGTNYITGTVQSLDSIAFYGERHKTLSGPEFKSATDAENWATYKLDEIAWPKIKAKATGLHVSERLTSVADLLRAEGFFRLSSPRSGLLPTYYEPLNGYFRYRNIDSTTIAPGKGGVEVRRDFAARKSGPWGRADFFVKKTGSPGALTLTIADSAGTTITTATVAAASIPEWYGWVTFTWTPFRTVKDATYRLQLSAASGDVSNYYWVGRTTYDAPYSGDYYSKPSGVWVESTSYGLLYRAYLCHIDEYLLAIKKVRYRVSTSAMSADLELGALEQPLEDYLLDLLRGLAAEELLQQSNTKELS